MASANVNCRKVNCTSPNAAVTNMPLRKRNASPGAAVRNPNTTMPPNAICHANRLGSATRRLTPVRTAATNAALPSIVTAA